MGVPLDFGVRTRDPLRDDLLRCHTFYVVGCDEDVVNALRERAYDVVLGVGNGCVYICDPSHLEDVLRAKPLAVWTEDKEVARVLREAGIRVYVENPVASYDRTLGSDPIYDSILRFARRYARSQGFRLNPDPEKLDEIIEGLAHNQRVYGFRYCPCRPLSGDPKEDAKKICPCFWHRKEIEEMGHCHCGLFWSAPRSEDEGR